MLYGLVIACKVCQLMSTTEQRRKIGTLEGTRFEVLLANSLEKWITEMIRLLWYTVKTGQLFFNVFIQITLNH